MTIRTSMMIQTEKPTMPVLPDEDEDLDDGFERED